MEKRISTRLSEAAAFLSTYTLKEPETDQATKFKCFVVPNFVITDSARSVGWDYNANGNTNAQKYCMRSLNGANRVIEP